MNKQDLKSTAALRGLVFTTSLVACSDAPATSQTGAATTTGGSTSTATTESTATGESASDPTTGATVSGPGSTGGSTTEAVDPTSSTEPTTGGACSPGALDCAGACVDPMADPNHCGGCDNLCDPAELCQQGACVSACDPGLTACRGACVDTTLDPEHCGGCDMVCAVGLSCLESECVELETCDGVEVAPKAVEVDPACLSPDVVVADPWKAVIEWQYKDGSSGSWSAPVVGQLTDDNGDGTIDAHDIPDVALTTAAGVAVALEPATGKVHWTAPNVYAAAATLIGDLDADGKNEVVTSTPGARPSALDGETGAHKWTALAPAADAYRVPVVADIDADGMPELLWDRFVVNGEDGSVAHAFPAPGDSYYWGSTMADLDLDGDQEILLSNKVYALGNNTPLWTALNLAAWPLVINGDDDPEAEVVMVARTRFSVWNHDGSQIAVATIPSGHPGPSVAADFDGDGAVEVAWSISTNLVQVYELDGTKLWSAVITESSGMAGCSAYDFDGDGAYELLLADEADLRIFDGATGTVRFTEPGHKSNTLFEYPTVADVDKDGSAEILFVSNNVQQYGTLTVLGHPDKAWLASGQSWGVHDFAVTNILPSGKIPTKPALSWQTYNVFRARPSIDDAAVDLSVQIIDACVPGCADGSIAALAVQVFNTGAVDVGAGVPVTLYRKDGDLLEVLETITLADPIPGGTGTAGILFEVPVPSIGADGLVVRVDDDGLGGAVQIECAESNNEAAWNGSPC